MNPVKRREAICAQNETSASGAEHERAVALLDICDKLDEVRRLLSAINMMPLDPIFAAIERHRAAVVAHVAATNVTDDVAARREGRKVTKADESAADAASEAEEEALADVISTDATTIDGKRAAVEYLLKHKEDLEFAYERLLDRLSPSAGVSERRAAT